VQLTRHGWATGSRIGTSSPFSIPRLPGQTNGFVPCTSHPQKPSTPPRPPDRHFLLHANEGPNIHRFFDPRPLAVVSDSTPSHFTNPCLFSPPMSLQLMCRIVNQPNGDATVPAHLLLWGIKSPIRLQARGVKQPVYVCLGVARSSAVGVTDTCVEIKDASSVPPPC
jgi:hypothetical protein